MLGGGGVMTRDAWESSRYFFMRAAFRYFRGYGRQ
jgi:hypothetical protein